MPSLTVRSFAELLQLPAYEQVRILSEQKNPQAPPQVFMVPFYQTALSGIRAYYRSGNDRQRIAAARLRASQAANVARRRNNERVLQAFGRGQQSRRHLIPTPRSPLTASLPGSVQLRLTFDLAATENGNPVYIFYNTRAGAIDAALARATLRLAHWVLDENGVAPPYRALEYVDLFTGVTHGVTRQSPRLLTQARANATIIATLWPTI